MTNQACQLPYHRPCQEGRELSFNQFSFLLCLSDDVVCLSDDGCFIGMVRDHYDFCEHVLAGPRRRHLTVPTPGSEVGSSPTTTITVAWRGGSFDGNVYYIPT